MNGSHTGQGWSVRAGVCVLVLAIGCGAAVSTVFVTADASAPGAAPAASGSESGSVRVEPAAAQVARSEQADVTFELRPGENGTVQLIGRRGKLEVTKTVHSTGEFELELAVDRDKVAIAVSSDATKVKRGKTTVSLSHGTEAEEEEMKIKRLLADSKAVAQFRRVAATLVDTEDTSPAATAFVLADSVVGSLTGDVGAPRRAAQHVGRRARRNVRPVGMAADCFYVMEQKMMFASNDYSQCWVSTMFNSFYQLMCSYRWLLQVESYWFSFISCSGFNWQ